MPKKYIFDTTNVCENYYLTYFHSCVNSDTETSHFRHSVCIHFQNYRVLPQYIDFYALPMNDRVIFISVFFSINRTKIVVKLNTHHSIYILVFTSTTKPNWHQIGYLMHQHTKHIKPFHFRRFAISLSIPNVFPTNMHSQILKRLYRPFDYLHSVTFYTLQIEKFEKKNRLLLDMLHINRLTLALGFTPAGLVNTQQQLSKEIQDMNATDNISNTASYTKVIKE